MASADSLIEKGKGVQAIAYQAVFEHALDAILIANDDGRLVDVNPAAVRLTGYTREELLRMGPLDLGEDPDVSGQAWNDFLGAGQLEGPFRLRRKDGGILFTDFRAVANIMPGLHLSILQDRSSQRAREESELRYTRLIEQSPLSVQILAPTGETIKVNKAWENLWGATLEMLGDYNVLQDPQLEEKGVTPGFRKALAGEPAELPAIPYVPPLGAYEGQERWVRAFVYPVILEGEVKELVLIHEDLTEKHQAQTDLIESEKRYRRIFEGVGSGIMISRDHIYQEVNPAICAYLNRAPDEIVGHDAVEFIPESWLPQLWVVRDALENVGEWSGVMPLTRADGDLCWFQWHAVRMEDGGTLAVATDITAVREAQENLRLTADALPVLISNISRERRFEFVNKGYEEWFQKPRSEIEGKLIEEVLGEELSEAVRPYVERALQGEEITFERKFPYPGGERFVHATYVPRRDETGQVVGFVGLVADISDQKRTEEALRQSEERARAAINAGQIGTWHWDIRTGLVEWSERTYEMHGLQPGEFDGSVEGFRELVHPRDRERVEKAIRAALQGTAPFQLDLRVVHPSGKVRWLTTSAQVLRDDQGEPISMLGATADITERKELEQELERRVKERTAELEAAHRDMEGFTYSVSHDLRAPLRGMVANARILEEDFGGELPPDALPLMQQISLDALKMAQLVDDLLQLTRIGRKELERSRIDVSFMVEDVVRAHKAEGTAVRVQPGMVADADPTLLRLAFDNLISNALKFAKQEQKAAIEVGLEDGAFFVKDHGIGFDMRYVNKIFVPFERLHTDQEYPGTGIGLANVKRIVELHGGRVWAESVPGDGACFRFTLAPSASE